MHRGARMRETNIGAWQVWFDKCFSLLVYSDARVAWHFEHSYADAPINGLMSEHGLVYSNDITRLYREYQTPFVPEYSRKVPVVPLRWQHPNLPAMLADARNEFSATVSNFACKPLYFAAFGVDRVKRAKISPDAFCQAVLQVPPILACPGILLTRCGWLGRATPCTPPACIDDAFLQGFVNRVLWAPCTHV
jgi:hypothetical protein